MHFLETGTTRYFENTKGLEFHTFIFFSQVCQPIATKSRRVTKLFSRLKQLNSPNLPSRSILRVKETESSLNSASIPSSHFPKSLLTEYDQVANYVTEHPIA